MRTLRLLALIGVVVSCHLDKLFNGGGRGPTAVSNGTPVGLTFSALPAGARAGSPIGIQVNVVDSAGVPVLGVDSTTVTLSLLSNPGGAPLWTTTAHPNRGVARFSDLTIDRATSGYTFQATDSNLTVTSDTFTVLPGPATQLTFTAQPDSASQGGVVTPPVVVTAFDSLGNKATDFTGTVTLALRQNGSIVPGVLSGATVNAVAGTATFDKLRVGNVGAGSYTLTAAFGGAAPVAESAPFQISPPPPPPPPPGNLVITTVTTGDNLPSGYAVTVDDNSAGTVAASDTKTIQGVAAGDHSVRLSNVPTTCGVVGANPMTVNVPAGGTGHGDFVISCGQPPSPPPPRSGPYLLFSDQPRITQAGQRINTVRVTVFDAAGNQNRTYTGDVTLSIAFNPSGGTLTGGGTITMDLGLGGVVEWNQLSIDKPGYGYILHATSPGLNDAFSDPLDITADAPPAPNGATGLGYLQEPSTTRAGEIMAPVRVVAVGPPNYTAITAYSGPVWISLGRNPSGATLTGTRRLLAVNGVVTFSDLRIDKPGTGYTLRVTAWPLNYKASVRFDVTP
jgi:hypothetical protein